jgi:FkbM family methyltransferase
MPGPQAAICGLPSVLRYGIWLAIFREACQVEGTQRRSKSEFTTRFQRKTMKTYITRGIRSLLKAAGIGITKHSTLESLYRKAERAHDLDVVLRLPASMAPQALRYLPDSKSQLRQDLFALACLGFKQNGFFVEFGATDGVSLSNTYLMEKQFGWTGILAEPATCWHDALRRNRTSMIDTRCVWRCSGETVQFKQVASAEFSTMSEYTAADGHNDVRRRGKTYSVATVSLNDLLTQHRAPREIDYLSIDTEGSEFEILKSFDFTQHTFGVITCEHNFTPNRSKVFELLRANGYTRVLEDVSVCDDWYVKNAAGNAVCGAVLGS